MANWVQSTLLTLSSHHACSAIAKWMGDMSRNLKREIKDLEDVRTAIAYLNELRERESDVDAFLFPVEEMYASPISLCSYFWLTVSSSFTRVAVGKHDLA